MPNGTFMLQGPSSGRDPAARPVKPTGLAGPQTTGVERVLAVPRHVKAEDPLVSLEISANQNVSATS